MIKCLFNIAHYFCQENEKIPRERKKMLQKIYYNGVKLICNILIELCLIIKYRLFKCNFEPLVDDVSKPIVSVTTFPKRIKSLWMVLYCIYHQTFRPGKIILTLTKEEFPEGLKSLPQTLTKLIDKGLEIVFTDYNLRPHNKYYYSLSHYPDRIIITLDDDLLYWNDTISRLMQLHNKYPECVCGNVVCKVNVSSATFKEIFRFDEKIESCNMALGVYGILYPLRFRPDELFKKKIIRELCLNADDIWLYLQENLASVDVIGGSIYNAPLMIINSQNIALMKENVMNNGNFKQFMKLKEHYNI